MVEDAVASREFASEKLFPHLGIAFEEIFTCIQTYYVYYMILHVPMVTTFFMFVLFQCVKRSSFLALVYLHIEQVNCTSELANANMYCGSLIFS